MNFPCKYHIFSSISLYPVMAIIEYWSTKLPPSPNDNIHNTISLFHTHTIYMVSSAYLQNDTTVTLRLRLNFYAHFGCSSSRTNVLPSYTFLVSTTGGSGAGLRFISSGLVRNWLFILCKTAFSFPLPLLQPSSVRLRMSNSACFLCLFLFCC